MKQLFLVPTLIAISINVYSQNVGIGTSSPHPSAKLEIASDSSGILIPRMMFEERDSIADPATGLLVFITNDSAYYFFDGSAWTSLDARTRRLIDIDQDTKVDVELSEDEDIIRFSMQGTEYFRMDSGRLEVVNTGGSVLIGDGAGASDDLSDNMNVAIGRAAHHRSTDRARVVAIGDSVLFNNGFGATENFQGFGQTAIGSKALFSNTLGFANTAVGLQSLYENTIGAANTAVGYTALLKNSLGSANTAIGYRAMLENMTGDANVAVGIRALFKSTTRSNLVAVGDSALLNSGVGVMDSLDATGNSAVGSKSLYTLETGYGNSAFGYEAGRNANGDRNVFLGYRAGYSEAGDSTLYIENSSSNSPLIFGDFAADSVSVNGRLTVSNNGNTSVPVDHPLHVVGKVQIEDGNQGDGYILCSDSVGVGSWGKLDASKLFGLGSTTSAEACLTPVSILDGFYNPEQVFVRDTLAYVLSSATNQLQIINVSSPTTPEIIGQVGTGDKPLAMYVDSMYAFVVNTQDHTLEVIDISDPTMPGSVGNLGIGAGPISIDVHGSVAYVADSSQALKTIDLSNPVVPGMIDSLDLDVLPGVLRVNNNIAYFLGDSATYIVLKLIDVTDPSSPSILSSIRFNVFVNGGPADDLFIRGDYAYFVYDNVLRIVDVSNPSAPVSTGGLGLMFLEGRSLFVDERYAYVTGNVCCLSGAGFLGIVDIEDPSAAFLVDSTYLFNGFPSDWGRAVYVQGDYAYVGTIDGDLWTIRTFCSPSISYDPVSGELENGSAIYWQRSVNNLFNLTTGNVGIGISTPSARLHVGEGGILSDDEIIASGVIASGDIEAGSDLLVTGKVGIGTNMPAASLHASGGNLILDRGADLIGVSRFLTIGGARNFFGSPYASIDFQNYDSDSGAFDYIGARISSDNTGSSNDGDLRFATYNGNLTTHMLIDNNGNIGMGTTSPQAKLHVFGGDMIIDRGTELSFIGRKFTISGAREAGSLSYAQLDFQNYDANSGGVEYTGARISSFNSDGNINGDLRFETYDNSLAVRMIIDTMGYVGIGTITPSTQLHTTGGVRFSNFGPGTVMTDGFGNLFISSDERLKEIASQYETGLNAIMQLDPINYRWKSVTGLDTASIFTGFSAQNVREAIPEAVGTDAKGFLTLSDRPVVATLVNAVKELAEENDLLKTQLQELASLKTEFNELKALIMENSLE